MPPHCPFDSIILGKLNLPRECAWKWTEATETDHRAWVSATKEAKNNDESLAEWEVRIRNAARVIA